MPRSDTVWKRDDGGRIYTRRVNLLVPESFATALKKMAADEGLSLSALALPWIEDGQRGEIRPAELRWGETGVIKQINLRIPKILYGLIRGERGKLPDRLVAGWILAGYEAAQKKDVTEL